MNKKNTILIFVLLIVIINCTLNSCDRINVHDRLKEGFVSPPDSARPGVYWYVMDGTFNRKAITDDLESMKKAGIGYAILLEVNVGVPRGQIDFLSEEWQNLFDFAVREAERCGITLILGSGPGWAGSGGPWVTPSESMMHLVGKDTVIKGPGAVELYLPKPQARKPFFGEGTLTPGLKKLRDDWYEDVKVLAFPAPENNNGIKRLPEKALYERAPYTSQEGVIPFIPFTSDSSRNNNSIVEKGRIIDISANMQPDGKLNWIVPPGKWVVIRFGKRNNGAITRPAPVPGLGFESDKFDTSAFRSHFDAYTGKLLKKSGTAKDKKSGWKMIHIDSWEMGAQNWSPLFMEQFIKRRGYDPLLYLPVMQGYIVNSPQESERFLWDLRQTANELVVENHASFYRNLGKNNGLSLSIEPYDMNPSADLDLGMVADVPMGEFWSRGLGFNSSFSCIEATSIAHVSGKPVVAAEAFTAGSDEAWRLYPGIMKDQTDWALALGLNRLFFHTFTHKSFIESLKPGMTMGPYGVHWDRGQTWWSMAGEYHKYVSRCQLVMSQGRYVSDILYLTPEGAPQVFRPPFSALEGNDTIPDRRSYSFDGCSPDYFIENAKAQDGRILFPGGASYRILVLPMVQSMTPELLSKIDMLLRNGITVMGVPPKRSPSLTNFPACDDVVKKFVESTWYTGTDIAGAALPTKKHNNGFIITPSKETIQKHDTFDIYPPYDETVLALKQINVKKDFSSNAQFRYGHVTTADRDFYFVSNRVDDIQEDSCTFRDGSANAEVWDPLTGKIYPLKGITRNRDGYSLKLRLEGHQSLFIVFYKKGNSKKRTNEEHDYFRTAKAVYTINAPWKAEFNRVNGTLKSYEFTALSDWSQRPEEDIRHFSGIAKYSCTFSLPDSIKISKKKEFFIDLGEVDVMAHVYLNGKDLGILWSAPFTVSAGGLKKDGNRLEVEVANLWINRLIGDESFPYDGVTDGKWPDWILKGTERKSGRTTFTTYNYYNKESRLVKSGLIGPVRIIESR